MNKRTTLAAATLAALPAVTAAAHHAQTMALTAPLAQWSYAFGLEGGYSFAWSLGSMAFCASFGPVGGPACAITGAL